MAERVLRQVRTGKLDEDRLLPAADKQTRDVNKRLDKLADRQGWYVFLAGPAYAMETGKAPARRNAEVMLVTEVIRWRGDVERCAADRLAEFDRGIADALGPWRTRRRCRGPRDARGRSGPVDMG